MSSRQPLVQPEPAPRVDDLRGLGHECVLNLTQAADYLGTVAARASEFECADGVNLPLATAYREWLGIQQTLSIVARKQ